jgi:excisionase family DNA binding protein
MERELLTVEEAATWLRVQPETVRAWIRSGRLPAVKLGRYWRLRTESLQRLLETWERPAIAAPPPAPEATG